MRIGPQTHAATDTVTLASAWAASHQHSGASQPKAATQDPWASLLASSQQAILSHPNPHHHSARRRRWDAVMDFTSQYQFAGNQHYQSFMPIPPLTPSGSHSAASDDFAANRNGSTTSPPDGFEGLPQTEQFSGLDYNNHHFTHHQNASFPGPPTPPNNSYGAHHNLVNQQNAIQQQQQQQQQNALLTAQDLSLAQADLLADEAAQLRAGSDDEDLTPAQSRRKAQNRAAQRAFRERKEKHVKDLENKLADLQAAQRKSALENERLRQDLQKMSTENEILRATSHMANGARGSSSPDPATTGPQKYSPTDFYSNVLKDHDNKTPSHRIVFGADGERLFAVGATWDYIISHELFKRGLVNIGDLSQRLQPAARCDGQGPVFAEKDIISALQQSVASGTDDLI